MSYQGCGNASQLYQFFHAVRVPATRFSQFLRLNGKRDYSTAGVGPWELVFAVLLCCCFIDADGPVVGRSGPAQAQERRRPASAGEGDGDIAVAAAEADLRRAGAGPRTRTSWTWPDRLDGSCRSTDQEAGVRVPPSAPQFPQVERPVIFAWVVLFVIWPCFGLTAVRDLAPPSAGRCTRAPGPTAVGGRKHQKSHGRCPSSPTGLSQHISWPSATLRHQAGHDHQGHHP